MLLPERMLLSLGIAEKEKGVAFAFKEDEEVSGEVQDDEFGTAGAF